MNRPTQYRQGDVLIENVENISADAVKQSPTDRILLAMARSPGTTIAWKLTPPTGGNSARSSSSR